jgi:hypothetical protein
MRITNASTLYSSINGALIRDSSAVEQEAVNFEVAGSNPVPGAKMLMFKKILSRVFLYSMKMKNPPVGEDPPL